MSYDSKTQFKNNCAYSSIPTREILEMLLSCFQLQKIAKRRIEVCEEASSRSTPWYAARHHWHDCIRRTFSRFLSFTSFVRSHKETKARYSNVKYERKMCSFVTYLIALSSTNVNTTFQVCAIRHFTLHFLRCKVTQLETLKICVRKNPTCITAPDSAFLYFKHRATQCIIDTSISKPSSHQEVEECTRVKSI